MCACDVCLCDYAYDVYQCDMHVMCACDVCLCDVYQCSVCLCDMYM